MNRVESRPYRKAWEYRLRDSQFFLHAGILLLLILSLVPIYLMISISFKNPIQYTTDRWALTFPFRLGNYSAALQVVKAYIYNTVYVAFTGLIGVLVISLIGGHIFARMHFPFKNQIYIFIIALLSVPWVLSFIPSYMMYNDLGMINKFSGLIVPNLVNGPIFGIFLLRSVISGIPEELYEAARCDGAGLLREIFSISLPLSLPGLATLTVWNTLGTWNWFLWPLVAMTDKEKQLISVGLTFLNRDLGATTANGPIMAGYVIASIPLVILFIFLGRFYIEGMMESGLKM
jgi:ABC-type glycerol-3-phosphate transport system permease component